MAERYTVIRSSRKTIAIQIAPDGRVLVRCPNRMPSYAIEAFVAEKSDWIQKHLLLQANRPQAAPFTNAQLQDFSNRTKALLQQRLPTLAQAIGVSYHTVTVRRQRTRWGSCSSKENLNFNCLLALMPPEVFDYVVVHELCHLKEMNHSPKFWAEVEKHLPDYKARKKWLKEQGRSIMERL